MNPTELAIKSLAFGNYTKEQKEAIQKILEINSELLEACKLIMDNAEPPTEDDECEHCFGKWTNKGYRHEEDCPYSSVIKAIAKAESN